MVLHVRLASQKSHNDNPRYGHKQQGQHATHYFHHSHFVIAFVCSRVRQTSALTITFRFSFFCLLLVALMLQRGYLVYPFGYF